MLTKSFLIREYQNGVTKLLMVDATADEPDNLGVFYTKFRGLVAEDFYTNYGTIKTKINFKVPFAVLADCAKKHLFKY